MTVRCCSTKRNNVSNAAYPLGKTSTMLGIISSELASPSKPAIACQAIDSIYQLRHCQVCAWQLR